MWRNPKYLKEKLMEIKKPQMNQGQEQEHMKTTPTTEVEQSHMHTLEVEP